MVLDQTVLYGEAIVKTVSELNSWISVLEYAVREVWLFDKRAVLSLCWFEASWIVLA